MTKAEQTLQSCRTTAQSLHKDCDKLLSPTWFDSCFGRCFIAFEQAVCQPGPVGSMAPCTVAHVPAEIQVFYTIEYNIIE